VIPCPRCAAVMDEDRTPSVLDQSGDTELPARRYTCPKCAAIKDVPTGDPWRPTLRAAIPPPAKET
jgi:acetone carboxylase gamma subunit